MHRVLIYGMTSNPGGIESYIRNLYREARKQDIVFDFLCDFPTMAYAEEFQKTGSILYIIPAKSRHPLQHLHQIWKVLRAHSEYEIVYYNILNAGAAFSMVIPRWLHRKIFVHAHNSFTDHPTLHRLFRPLLNALVQQRYSCAAGASVFMYGAPHANEARFIPNAIDVERWTFRAERRQKVRQALHLKNDVPVVIHVGRISQQKNPHRVLDIFNVFAATHPNAVLLYVGDGEMREEVRQHAARLNGAAQIRFLGIRKDIADLFAAADVFLFPSLYEGLSIVILEAQAASLPIVCSEAISQEEMVTPLVHPLSLEQENAKWAEEIGLALNDRRVNTRPALEAAGFSIYKIHANTRKLIESFGKQGAFV